jgi:hypothetical protein
MAEVVRLPPGTEPPHLGNMVVLSQTVSGLYSCEGYLSTAEGQANYQIFGGRELEQGLGEAIRWADENGVAVVYLTGA